MSIHRLNSRDRPTKKGGQLRRGFVLGVSRGMGKGLEQEDTYLWSVEGGCRQGGREGVD